MIFAINIITPALNDFRKAIPTVPIINIGPLIDVKESSLLASFLSIRFDSYSEQMSFAPIGYPDNTDKKNVIKLGEFVLYNLLKNLSAKLTLRLDKLTINLVNIKNGNKKGSTLIAHIEIALRQDLEYRLGLVIKITHIANNSKIINCLDMVFRLFDFNFTFIYNIYRKIEGFMKNFTAKKKLALVLSGGSSKGFAHIGVIKVLEANGIKPDLIVGTSMGALIGGVYASGQPIEEIEKLALSINKLGSFDLYSTMFKDSLLNINKIKRILKDILGDTKQENCPIKFISVATELNTGKEVHFSEGLLRDAILASISVPVVFPRVKLGDNYYVDGGLVNNLPEDVAREVMPDAVIVSVDVIGDYAKQLGEHKMKTIETAINSIALMTQEMVRRKPVLADLRLVITQQEIGQLDYSNKTTYTAIKNGENATNAQINSIKKLLKGEINETHKTNRE